MRYRVTKASAKDKADYADKRINGAVHPLYGFVWVGRRKLYVEYLGEGRGEPNYEVMASNGLWFYPDGVTTLLCFSLEDVDCRLQGNILERRPADK